MCLWSGGGAPGMNIGTGRIGGQYCRQGAARLVMDGGSV